jgi:hypothetical protein
VVFARWCSGTFQSGCTEVVRQALFQTLYQSWPQDSVPWPPVARHESDIYLTCGVPRKIQFTPTLLKLEKLWKRIQDAANEIPYHTWGFTHVRTSFQHRFGSCIYAHGINLEHLQHENPPSAKHVAFQRRSNIIYTSDVILCNFFYKSIPGTLFIWPFWLTLTSYTHLPFMVHILETPCITYELNFQSRG